MERVVRPLPGIELWGGVECTVRRAGEEYLDELELTGHSWRADDIQRFAELGIKRIRFPILWERVAANGPAKCDWSWSDHRLGLLRSLNVEPIVGLLHHGSGPKYTSLVDRDFPTKFADYALLVARRYPSVEMYTPINEPLTTARFSGLYGLWYPHGRDSRTFARSLVQQCRGIVLAMQAIRSVNARARLIQTEDVAKVYATASLEYQAKFENERRWLSFDLLMGRLRLESPIGCYLRQSGIAEKELEWFLENRVVPDMLGLNYYLTSERYLDERLTEFPTWCHGGNGRDRYADVEAVRVLPEGLAGFDGLLTETWERYHRPLALTEVHVGCHRESQLRWLDEAWRAVNAVQRQGVTVSALTVWSMLGAYDWDSLLVDNAGRYEPGIFDVRGRYPRATALAGAVRQLARGQEMRHPTLAQAGWWRQPERIIYRVFDPEAYRHAGQQADEGPPGPPLLIAGGNGTLGAAFARICQERRLAYRVTGRQEMDITLREAVSSTLRQFRPWAVVNTAGYVRVDDAEKDRWQCYRGNSFGPTVLARACASAGVPLLTFSSDLVFDGRHRHPYLEHDLPNPLSCYGRSKEIAERRVLKVYPRALVIRTSAFFGPWDPYNFVSVALERLVSGRRVVAADDAYVSPTYVPDLVHACLDLLIDGESGIWHLSNETSLTWFEFAGRAAELAGVDRATLRGRPEESFRRAAPRPQYSVLNSKRGQLLSSLDEALGCYVGERRARECAETSSPSRGNRGQEL